MSEIAEFGLKELRGLRVGSLELFGKGRKKKESLENEKKLELNRIVKVINRKGGMKMKGMKFYGYL